MNKFKKHIIQIALLVGLIIPTLTNAQVRPDIFSFTSTQRAELADLIIDFVNPDILQYHCDYTTIMSNGIYDIHDDFNFLPFHRSYLEKLEDYLLEQGYPQYVPLPKWTGLVAPPIEFSTAGPNGNGVDPDCGSTTCANAPNNCNPPTNWSATVSMPNYLTLPVQSGSGNDLCDWNMNPSTFTVINDQTGSNGLSRRIETPWHNSGHINTGGVMLNFRSPAAAIFWLWHAAVDDKWREWECNCPQATTLPFDMYMKDNEYVVQHFRDRGEEPNIDQGPMWESEDVWIRNQNDGLTNHENQNPDHFTNGGSNFVYVQVRNRGCIASGGAQVTLHWAKAGTALSYPTHWDGSLMTSNNQQVGDEVSTVNLPSIEPGSSHIAVFQWNPPDPENYVGLFSEEGDPLFWAEQPHHFCLLARINSTNDPITFTNGSDIQEYTRQNNNVVWKNITVVDLPGNIVPEEPEEWLTDEVKGASIFIGDAWGGGGDFDIEFRSPTFHKGNPVTVEAEVIITLDNQTWQEWNDEGQQADNIAVKRVDKNRLILDGASGRLENIHFEPNERRVIHVGFNFLAKQLSGQSDFRFQVIQRRRSDNKIMGGETYDIRIPGRPGFYADAGGDKEISEGESTNLNAYDIGEAAIYNWYDQDGNLIYTGTDFTVSPEITEKYKLEVIAQVDGVKDYDEVEVKVKEYEILSISPNPSSDQVSIGYKASTASSAYLMITMAYGYSYNYILDINQQQTSIDVSAYQTGIYNVILVCDGQAVDGSTLVVQ